MSGIPKTIKLPKATKTMENPSQSVSHHPVPAPTNKASTLPPVFIQDIHLWNIVTSAIEAKRVNILRTQCCGSDIKVLVQTSRQHTKLTKFLRKENISFYTYTLPEKRLLRVVVRGLFKELDTVSVSDDLKAQKFPVRGVYHLSGRHKTITDLFIVALDLTPEGNAIFDVDTICGLSGITVEPLKKSKFIGQCHKCQRYGHVQRHCNARPRCVKCTGDHSTADCTRPKEPVHSEPPSCVLCGTLGHTANYRGCPKAPRKTAQAPSCGLARLPNKLHVGDKPVVPHVPPTHKLATQAVKTSAVPSPIPVRRPRALKPLQSINV